MLIRGKLGKEWAMDMLRLHNITSKFVSEYVEVKEKNSQKSDEPSGELLNV